MRALGLLAGAALLLGSGLASAGPALTATSQARCEAFAELHYAMAEEVGVDADSAWENAYAACVGSLFSQAQAMRAIGGCKLMVSGIEREPGSGYAGYNWGSTALWVPFCQDETRE